MDQKTEAALRASIQHWEENAAITRIRDANLTQSACALYSAFYNLHCAGCPVAIRTGKSECRDTPYYDASTAEDRRDLPAFLEAAKAELEFLRSLLPTQES